MAHECAEASESRTFHLEVGHAQPLIFEGLYFLVQQRVGQRQAQLTALWTEETATGYGHAT